jgi:hypothetical protein
LLVVSGLLGQDTEDLRERRGEIKDFGLRIKEAKRVGEIKDFGLRIEDEKRLSIEN